MHHEERRAQLLKLASDLFARKGFHRSTTKEIARRAKVSEAMIFKHFPSKEELFAACLDMKARLEDPLAVVAEAAEKRDDAAVFGGIGRHLIERVEKDPAFLRLLLFTALEHPKLFDAFFEAHVRRIQEFLTQYISLRIADGVLKPLDPFLMARSFIGMVSHYLLAQEIFGLKKKFPIDRDKALEIFVQIFLDGAGRDREE